MTTRQYFNEEQSFFEINRQQKNNFLNKIIFIFLIKM